MSDFEKLAAAYVVAKEAQRPFGRFTMFVLKTFAVILCILGVFGLLGGQVKSGQRWTGQNRPTTRTQDQFASIPRSPRPATSDGCASSSVRI
jgi:hypothetical protein